MQQFTKQDVDIEKEETVYDGFFTMKRFTLKHKLFEGGSTESITRENLLQGEAVAVILYDPNEDVILLGKQFRVGTMREPSPWLLEVVAGRFEEGETPDEVAIRESEEEMQADIKKLIHLFDFYSSPGATDEKVYYYCGIVDSRNMKRVCGLKEENEDISVDLYKLDDAIQMVKENKIQDGIAIVGIQWLALNRDELVSELN
jgi:ADP-ribose pyrophosphatase